MPEFALIKRLARVVETSGDGVALSIGDDAAVLDLAGDERLVVATDTLNEDVHFLAGADAERLGHKALAVNLSDLAAMGAVPRWALLNLSLPSADEQWIDAFAKGFGQLAARFGVALVGGDTCVGSRSISVTVLGTLAEGRPVCRSGAMPGDVVMVSGTLGGAAAALADRLAGKSPLPILADRLDVPEPRVALGAELAGIATACIDISDGLAADLAHLAGASGLGAEVFVERLPLPPGLVALPEPQRWALQTSGGEDYELCFTVPESHRADVNAVGAEVGVELTEIGRMVSGSGVRFLAPGGAAFEPPRPGWEHFRNVAGTDE